MPPKHSPSITIRPFAATSGDYATWLHVRNAVWADEPTTAAILRYEDAIWPRGYFSQRLLIEHGGTVVATAHVFENHAQYHPGKYDLELLVHPDHQGCGIGGAAYARLLDRVHRRTPAPTSLVSPIREDHTRALAFLEKRGFKPVMRWNRSRLDLGAFDPDRFADAMARVHDQGITLYSVAEVSRTEPDWQRKFYKIDQVAGQDAPSPDPQSPETLEKFIQNTFEHPRFLPEGTFVAVAADGQYLGSTELADTSGGEHLTTPFTCVHPGYRRRGIALALKARAARFARTYGARSITAANEENNPMYAINVQLNLASNPCPKG